MIFCSCVNETTLFSLLRSRENGRPRCNLDSRASQKRKNWGREWSLRFQKIFIKKQTRWSNDKAIIKLGYRKISWFVSVSQLKYLPQPSLSANNWSARHWQITIFCSTSSNNCINNYRSRITFSLACVTDAQQWLAQSIKGYHVIQSLLGLRSYKLLFYFFNLGKCNGSARFCNLLERNVLLARF